MFRLPARSWGRSRRGYPEARRRAHKPDHGRIRRDAGGGRRPGAGERAQAEATERFEPADSIEGNYLAALIAGSARDTGAAATFLREALKYDPRNMELLERSFVAFLADGAMQDAFRAAERIVARDPQNGLAQMTLAVRAIRNKQWAAARERLRGATRGARPTSPRPCSPHGRTPARASASARWRSSTGCAATARSPPSGTTTPG